MNTKQLVFWLLLAVTVLLGGAISLMLWEGRQSA